MIIDLCRVINGEFLAAPICDFMLVGHHFQLQNEFAVEFVKAVSALGKSKVKSGVVQSLLSLGDIRNFEWNEWWRRCLVTELGGWGSG